MTKLVTIALAGLLAGCGFGSTFEERAEALDDLESAALVELQTRVDSANMTGTEAAAFMQVVERSGALVDSARQSRQDGAPDLAEAKLRIAEAALAEVDRFLKD